MLKEVIVTEANPTGRLWNYLIFFYERYKLRYLLRSCYFHLQYQLAEF